MLWRALTDVDGWRRAGRDEFAFATQAVTRVGGLGMLRFTIGALAVMMLPVALGAELMPYAPNTPALRAVHVVAGLLGATLGVLWIVRPWPRLGGAIAFLAASDVLLAIGFAILGRPEARISASNLFAMMGMYAAFLLGWRVLVLHCAFAFAVIGAMTWYAVAIDGRHLLDLVAFTAPALLIVIALPVTVQVVVEAMRFALTRVATEWSYDSLTGVFNRRGWAEETTRLVVAHRGISALYLSAVIDLDDFKAYNDTYGHPAGDELLTSVAERLKAGLPHTVVARNGGDEFAVFGVFRADDEARRTVDALRALVAPREGDGAGRIRASVGVALLETSDHSDLVEVLTSEADRSLYEAKDNTSEPVVVADLRGAPLDQTAVEAAGVRRGDRRHRRKQR